MIRSLVRAGAAAAALLLFLHALPAPASGQAAFDLLITGGTVLDGTGNPGYEADVGVRDGRIAAVGRLPGASAGRTVDASGLVVAPGFIDVHSHAQERLNHEDPFVRSAPSLVAQGITTLVVNPDGGGNWPIGEQLDELRELGTGPHVIALVPHGQIRRRAMDGNASRPMTEEEVERLRGLVRQGMEEGAWGLSAGLEYNPGRYATTDEVVAAVEEIVPWDGVYIVHQRSEGPDPMWYWPSQDDPGPPDLLDAVMETIEIAERTGAVAVASHIKAKGAHYWGTSEAVIRLIQAARDRGVRIYADQYSYETTGTDGRLRLIPGWAVAEGRRLAQEEDGDADPTPAEAVERLLASPDLAADLRGDIAHEIRRRGDPERLVVLEHPDEALVGMNVAEISELWGVDPVEVAIRFQLEGAREERGGARLRGLSLSHVDVERYAREEWMLTASDARIGLPDDGLVHPRFFGNFPRKLAHYARDREVISMAHAVRSATWLPAQVLGIRDRGQVREGFHADLVLFHPEEIEDRTTILEPTQYPAGIPYVLVEGQFVVDGGELTGALPGRVLTPETDR